MLTITHTAEAGTLIEGTARGDGTAQILKANGWRWGRSISAWFVPASRDHHPKSWIIDRTTAALRAAGFEVAHEIDDTWRPTEQVEADKLARQAARVEALDAKADRKANAAEAAWQRHERDAAALPEGGEPIHVGHHSEGRHRRAIARAHDSMRASIDAANDAERAADRANAAAHTTDARYSASTVANRIKKIGADIRRLQRAIDEPHYDPQRGYVHATDEQKAARGTRLDPRIAELRDQLAYWTRVRDEQVATGAATNYTREQIHPGDAVKVHGHWRRVVRANPTTVSVESGFGWTDKATYAAIDDHRTAAQVATAAATQ
ncbi:MAG: hypothetical protein BGO26_00115 [Actinobacteria bacterium 69-20]|jgi:hypothetical protein|nr:MAG: hypothetical protein BGO26_00115 [Actinobacteria bacterium 69-20]